MQVGMSYSNASYAYQQKPVSGATSTGAATSASVTSPQQKITVFEQHTGIRGLDQAGFDLSGLLSSDTRTLLNQQQVTSSNDTNSHTLTGREALGKMLSEANSASDDTLTSMRATSTPLTNDDLAFLKKVSGYNVIMGSDGAMMLVDDNGNVPPDGSDTKGLVSMIAQMEIDRQTGTLTGPITKDYIEGLFARAKQAGSAFDDAFQQKVLSQFGSTDQSKSTSESNAKKMTDASG
jgi:hypothetical protein